MNTGYEEEVRNNEVESEEAVECGIETYEHEEEDDDKAAEEG